MTTYSTSLSITLIPNGTQSGTWGTTTNTNWDLVDQAIAGVDTITMTNANYTLTSTSGVVNEARNMVIVATGSLSATYKIVAPLVPKLYLIENSTTGGQDITIGGATGSAVTIPNGYSILVYCDGSDFYSGSNASYGDFLVQGNLGTSGDVAVGGSVAVAVDAAIAGNLTVSGSTNIVPLGSVIAYATIFAPSGFLACNGQAVSRGTYAALFALIGTTFGSGDGATTFNLPNIANPITGVIYVIKY